MLPNTAARKIDESVPPFELESAEIKRIVKRINILKKDGKINKQLLGSCQGFIYQSEVSKEFHHCTGEMLDFVLKEHGSYSTKENINDLMLPNFKVGPKIALYQVTGNQNK